MTRTKWKISQKNSQRVRGKKTKKHMERGSEWNEEAIINYFGNRRRKVMHPIFLYLPVSDEKCFRR